MHRVQTTALPTALGREPAPVAPADRHPVAVYLARLAPGSRRTMATALETMARLLTGGAQAAASLDWAALRYSHTAALRALLAERYAPATANKHLAALRGVLREAWRLGLLPAAEYARAADLPAVRGTSLPRGRALSAGEVRALFTVCAADPSPAGARDAALLAILYGAGLRRAEIVALDMGDVDLAAATVTVRRGKGRQARVAYLPPGAFVALTAWLSVRGAAAGPLFWPVNKGGTPTARRLSDQAVLGMLRKRAGEAGIDACSPHDLRRTMIGDLLDAGADISTVQRLAGHANVQTTARYDRRDEGTKRRAAALLHVPYGG